MTAMFLSAQRVPDMLFVDVGDGIPDRRQSVLVVTTTTLAIATIFVAARLVSRLVIVRRVTWDDYLIVLGWVSVSFIDKYHGDPAQRDAMLSLPLKLYDNICHDRYLLSD